MKMEEDKKIISEMQAASVKIQADLNNLLREGQEKGVVCIRAISYLKKADKSNQIADRILDEYSEEHFETARDIQNYRKEDIIDVPKEEHRLKKGIDGLDEIMGDGEDFQKHIEKANWKPDFKDVNSAYLEIKRIYEKWSKGEEIGAIDKIIYHSARSLIYDTKADELINSLKTNNPEP
jgi:hypothetical protein